MRIIRMGIALLLALSLLCAAASAEDLACENMFIAAKVLGYGAKIVSSPTMQLNGDNHDALCEKLGVDPSYTAVAVLLIGYEGETADATSGASTRSEIDEKVSFVK